MACESARMMRMPTGVAFSSGASSPLPRFGSMLTTVILSSLQKILVDHRSGFFLATLQIVAYDPADAVYGHVLFCPHDSGRHRDGEFDSAFQSWKLFADKEKSVSRDVLCHGFHFALISLQADSESHGKTYCCSNWIVSRWHLPLSHARPPLYRLVLRYSPALNPLVTHWSVTKSTVSSSIF